MRPLAFNLLSQGALLRYLYQCPQVMTDSRLAIPLDATGLGQNQNLVTCLANATTQEAIRMMVTHGITSVPLTTATNWSWKN